MGTIAAQEPRLNEAIKVKECRLIAYDGSQLGIFPIEQAQRIALDDFPLGEGETIAHADGSSPSS